RLRVLHIAALISYRTRDTEHHRLFNLEGTRAILRASLESGVERLCHISSIVAVGHSSRGQSKREDAAFNGADLGVDYVTTKRAAEDLVLAAKDEIDVVVASPGAIFGPTTRPSNSAELLDRVAKGKAPWLGPPGGTSVVGVEDTAHGCVLALDRGRRGERYVLAERFLSHFELLRQVAARSGTRGPVAAVPKPLWALLQLASRPLDRLWPQDLITPQALTMLALDWNLDAAKAREELGWQPEPFEAVLERTLASLPDRSQ
ncbi:MAG: NAD-dependent epimerase/dehydratase family protein, partial [Planctomycetota bacterium]